MTDTVTLRSITEANRVQVLEARASPDQEQFVGSIREALEEAAAYPQAKPWYRAIYVGDEPIGFVMLSWNVHPQRLGFAPTGALDVDGEVILRLPLTVRL